MSYIKINDEEIALIWLHLPIALETDQKRTVEIRNIQKDPREIRDRLRSQLLEAVSTWILCWKGQWCWQ